MEIAKTGGKLPPLRWRDELRRDRFLTVSIFLRLSDGLQQWIYHSFAMQTDAIAVQAERRIFLIRGLRVMLDYDLAELYGVATGALNRGVKRNADRFPKDFMFQLTAEEAEHLKCQIGISSDWGGRRRSLPYAFTEQGVAMLSSVLRSRRAV